MRKYRCLSCSAEYSVSDHRFKCDCGGAFELVHDHEFAREKIDLNINSLWRYKEIIPIENEKKIVTLGEGMTPLVHVNFMGHKLYAKVEYMSPTGSFKDRGASVLFSLMNEFGIKECVEDSSGNAGSAASAYGARAGIKCKIFCPDYTSEGKLTQVRFYGAELNKIKGTREDTARAVQTAAQKIYYASHNHNPFFVEGLKTIAYEIAEQFNWQMPDNVVTPLGFGGLYYGLYLGFKAMFDSGATDKIPKLLGVQSDMCCPLYEAVNNNYQLDPEYIQTGHTLAEGVCGTRPVWGEQVLKAIKESKGGITTVNEDDILKGIRVLSKQGIFVEPTSAIVVKGFEHFVENRKILPEHTTVAIITGFGLKSIDKYQRLIGN